MFYNQNEFHIHLHGEDVLRVLVQLGADPHRIDGRDEQRDLHQQHTDHRFEDGAENGALCASQYILFEGTDVNIEGELLKAAGIVPRSKDIVEKLITNFNFPIEFANASYYRKGTPRYFKYEITDHPIILQPQNEIDGYINLIFNEDLTVDALKQLFAVTVEVTLRIKSQFFNDIFYTYSRFRHFSQYSLVLLFQHPLFSCHTKHFIEFDKKTASSHIR